MKEDSKFQEGQKNILRREDMSVDDIIKFEKFEKQFGNIYGFDPIGDRCVSMEQRANEFTRRNKFGRITVDR